jgi:O-antigen ligase
MTVPLWREPLYDFLAGPRYTGRQALWRAAWNVACDYPLLGTGLGNCQEFMNQYIDTTWLQNQNTHNLYLRNAADMGFLAAILTLVFNVMFFYYSWSIEKNLKSNYLRLAVRGTMATYLVMFVHNMFQNGTFLTYFTAGEAHIMFPYILLALPFAAKKLDQRGEAG